MIQHAACGLPCPTGQAPCYQYMWHMVAVQQHLYLTGVACGHAAKDALHAFLAARRMLLYMTDYNQTHTSVSTWVRQDTVKAVSVLLLHRLSCEEPRLPCAQLPQKDPADSRIRDPNVRACDINTPELRAPVRGCVDLRNDAAVVCLLCCLQASCIKVSSWCC